MREVLLSLLIAGCGAGVAFGEEAVLVHRTASDAFADGRYAEAASLATEIETADAYALAARAVLAEAMCAGAQPSDVVLARAETLADMALELDPDHVEGRLQLAIAYSLKMRPMTKMEAWRSGLGEDARALAESVIADDPANAYAHGFLAVWHVEVVRRGGSFGASMMNASLEDAFVHYQAAVSLAPGDAGLHWQMARALAALDPERYRDRIELALTRAMATNGETVLQRVMAARAWRLSDAMTTEDSKAVEALAASLL